MVAFFPFWPIYAHYSRRYGYSYPKKTALNNPDWSTITSSSRFRLEKTNVRGRMVRLGSSLAEMMALHKYPPPVAALLSEVVTLCLLLAGMLKYEGIFTLQIKGSGPIRLLVADVTSRGEVRAYAGFDAGAVKKAAKRKKDLKHNYYYLLGKKGYIAFTVDQGRIEDRYQGIVELKGSSIVDAVQHYLTQSEQVKTSFKLAVHPQDAQWRTGAIMIQQLPDEHAGKGEEASIEDWTRAVMLLGTITDGGIMAVAAAGVVGRAVPPVPRRRRARLFAHAYPLQVPLLRGARHHPILRTIPRPELEDVCDKEGHVSIKCEFCSEEYIFARDQLDDVYEEKKS